MPQSNLIYPPRKASDSDLELFFLSPDPVEITIGTDKNGKQYETKFYRVKRVGHSSEGTLVLRYERDVIKTLATSRPGPADLCKVVCREQFNSKKGRVYDEQFLILPQETHPNYSDQEQKPLPPVASYNKPHNAHNTNPSRPTPSTVSLPKTTTKLTATFSEKDASIQAGMILKILVPESVVELGILRSNASAGDKLDAMNTIKSRATLLMSIHNELTKIALDVFHSPPELAPQPAETMLTFDQAPELTTEDAPTFKLPYQPENPINLDDIAF